MTILLVILLGANLAALAVMTARYRRGGRVRRARVAADGCPPAKAPYVLDLEARRRWEAVDLALLHEVNREEYLRVLAKAKVRTPRALTDSERAFLDRMAEAERRVRLARRRPTRPARPRAG